MLERSYNQTKPGIGKISISLNQEQQQCQYELTADKPAASASSNKILSSPTAENTTMESSTSLQKRPAPHEDHGGVLDEGRAQRPPLKIARTLSTLSVNGLHPPENFAQVTKKVFRSSFPKPENLAYLKTLELKSILTLVPETYPEDNVKFLQENGIKHYQIGMPGNKENSITPVSDEKITAALSIILNRSNHPLLIHCNKGKHRTGCVVGCLRKFQAWSVQMAVDEYRRFAGAKCRAHDQLKIEKYNLEACWDIAKEYDWIPTSLPIENEDEDTTDTPLSIMGRAAIKAQ